MASRPVKKISVVLKKRPPDGAAPSAGADKLTLLSSFIDRVFSSRGAGILDIASAAFSFEELYGAVANACLDRRGGELYALLKQATAEHARRLVLSLDASGPDVGAASFAAAVQSAWGDFCAHVLVLRAVFSYLDRGGAAMLVGAPPPAAASGRPDGQPGAAGGASSSFLPLAELGPALFGDALVAAPRALGRTVSAVVSLLHAERDAGAGADAAARPAADGDADAAGMMTGDPATRVAGSTATVAAVSRMLSSLGGPGSGGGSGGGGGGGGGLFSSHLEPAVLRSTEQYYDAEGAREAARLEPAAYMAHASERMRQEQERCRACLGPQTWRLLRPILQRRLVAQHSASLLERGFLPLIAAGRTADLSLMFALLSDVGKADDLRRCYSDYAKATAKGIVGTGDDEERDKVLVQGLLDFREAQDRTVSMAFQGHEAFRAALRGAIEVAANSRENKPAELVAKYIDARLRAGGKSVPSGAGVGAAGAGAGVGAGAGDSLDASLDRILALFRVLHGKDVFEAFYKKDLAKRLLLGRSSSVDVEKSMVSRLKTECGSAFTSKLEGMFKDTELSAELNAQYAAVGAGGPGGGAAGAGGGAGGGVGGGGAASPRSPGGGAAAGRAAAFSPTVDAYFHVLTASYWPNYDTALVKLPTEVLAASAGFERFYLSRYSSKRRLAWVHSLGHCIVRARFPLGNKMHELDVSAFQALVLLLFNSAPAGAPAAMGDAGAGGGAGGAAGGGGGGAGGAGIRGGGAGIPFPSIKEATGIPDADLRRTLQSLALGQVRVLRKEPKGREVEDGDVFFFNEAFAHPLVRIKINQIQMKETKQEADSTNERVMQDRQHQVDAAIVRIMKSRKTLGHQALLAELFSQLRFSYKPADVKKRIESLMERDYLERDGGGDGAGGGGGAGVVYHYLA